jgi:hypothetical protein
MTDLSLFASLLGKAGLYTGLLPGMFLAAIIEAKYHRLQKFWERAAALDPRERWQMWRKPLRNFRTPFTSWSIRTAIRSGPDLSRSAQWKNRLLMMVRLSSPIIDSSARADSASKQFNAESSAGEQLAARIEFNSSELIGSTATSSPRKHWRVA